MFLLREQSSDTLQFAKSFDGTIDAFSIMAFAFMCHHNSFFIYNSMSKPNLKNWKRVTHISLGTSITFSIAFGLVGYLTFTNKTQGSF